MTDFGFQAYVKGNVIRRPAEKNQALDVLAGRMGCMSHDLVIFATGSVLPSPLPALSSSAAGQPYVDRHQTDAVGTAAVHRRPCPHPTVPS